MNFVRRRFRAWWQARLPLTDTLALTQRNVYILPTRAGFMLAQAALFTCIARGFGSKRYLRDFAIGLALGAAVFLFFVKFLNVNLPPGWLAPIMRGAGI